MNEQLDFLREIVSRLEGAGIPYMVTGSLAMTFYATPRMTRDIDVVLELDVVRARRIVALFQDDCYIEHESVLDAVSREASFNIIHNERILKADFIVRKDDPYRREEFRRRRRMRIEDGFEVWVVTPEDLVLSKLAWNPVSELQLRDVSQLVEEATALDWDYVERWARHLGVQDALQSVRNA